MKTIKGELITRGKRFALVVSRFNELISHKLLEGAIDTLVRHGAKEEEIEIIWVPGAFEIPAVCRKLIARKKYDALVCLGAIIRGGTPHFEYIAAQTSRGIARLSAEASIPVSFGVLTCDSLEQASERAGGKNGNKGSQAALSAIEMINLYQALGQK